MPGGILRVFPDADALASFAVDQVLSQAHEAVRLRDRFFLAVSGGRTPKKLLQLLGMRPYRDLMPWKKTHVFWVDERMVPYESPESNYGEAWRLLFSQGMIPEQNLHPVDVGIPIEQSRKAYQEEIQSFARERDQWPRFDLVLLGMGSDGHTASLFPGEISMTEHAQPVIAVQTVVNDRPSLRISMTFAILNRSEQILIMVVGKEKAESLATVFAGDSGMDQLPIQRIQPQSGRLIWLVDQDAASFMDA